MSEQHSYQVWRDPALATKFLEGIRGGVPFAADQIDLMLRVVQAAGVPVDRRARHRLWRRHSGPRAAGPVPPGPRYVPGFLGGHGRRGAQPAPAVRSPLPGRARRLWPCRLGRACRVVRAVRCGRVRIRDSPPDGRTQTGAVRRNPRTARAARTVPEHGTRRVLLRVDGASVQRHDDRLACGPIISGKGLRSRETTWPGSSCSARTGRRTSWPPWTTSCSGSATSVMWMWIVSSKRWNSPCSAAAKRAVGSVS